ncbi:MAG: methionyl-tRNA formyltransferase [Proteobacteria bacterium]|nr:methionyl-tRNA formyltransferase [Pseudomonadota bacterium]
MKVGFAGTPEFARAALAAICAGGHVVPLVLSQPDRPAGRGMRLTASPVKAYAVEHGLPVAQPRSLRLAGKYPDDAARAADALQMAALDVLVVAAYGLILPAWVLARPRHGCINIHASLLPRWRGAAPIQRAIEAGDATTGITIMQMDAGLDTGAMLRTEAIPIAATDTAATLHDTLATLGARMVVEVLAELAEHGALAATPQPEAGVTYAAKIDKAEAEIDWSLPAEVIERRLRAFDPFPGGLTHLGGESIKCWRGSVAAGPGAPGEVLDAGASGLLVACAAGSALRLTELQRAGGKRLSADAFLQGLQIPPGSRLGPPR